MRGTAVRRPRTCRQQKCRVALLLIGFALIVLRASVASAQPPAEPNAFDTPVTVNPPRERLRAMFEAATFAEREQFPAAAKALQSVLESPEDYFLEHDMQATLKQRAIALLNSWPQAGRNAYERLYSADAAVLWERTQRSGAETDWSEILSQYWMTPAGRTAVFQRAAQAFDAGEPLQAARYWLQVRETHGADHKDLAAAFREALAWELAGRSDMRRARLAMLGLETNLEPFTLGGRTFSGANALDEATEWIGTHIAASAGERGRRTVVDWLTARGDATRNAVALPAGPIGTPLWTAELLGELCDPFFGEASPHRRLIVQQTYSDLLERLISEDRITIPAVVPIVSQKTIVLRTLSGLAAFDLETGALKWRSALDESVFRKQWNVLPKQPDGAGRPVNGEAGLQPLLRERVFRDHLLGTIACNDRLAFAIESNLEIVPPTPRNVIRGMPDVPDPVNRLTAFDLQGGQLLWELGGPRGEAELPLAGHFFLGPPLVMRDTLYCLAEIDSELRLLQLRIDSETQAVSLVWSQVLVAPDQLVSSTALRRLSGLTPTWAEGLLLCPTGCGVLVAVDPLRKQLAWGFQYESLEPRQLNQRTLMMMRQAGSGRVIVPVRPDEEIARWIDAMPLYAQGHVLFTPRDGSELICLDAVNGEVRWRRPRGAALMIAGVQDDRVIVVGRTQMESLRLSDGEPVWTLPTPIPSGQGLLLAQRYLLPVIDNQILTIDLMHGRVLSHSQIDPAVGTGNLVAAAGGLIVASPRGIAKFAAMSQLEAELQQRLAANANDPTALALRGELRLHRGEQTEGLADLRSSLQQRPDARAATLLASALLDGLRTDFPRFRERAGEIEQLLADSPVRSEFLRTYAQALADAGDPLAAFAEYLKLVVLADYEERLERVSGGWLVRGDRVVRAQVRKLYQSVSSTERKQLDAALAAFVTSTETNEQSVSRDRRVLRFFDGLPALDAVRMKALSRSSKTPTAFEWLTARQLARSSQKEAAALGTAWLAQTLLNQKRDVEAGPWIDRLNREFASNPISTTSDTAPQTGQQLAASLKERWTDPLSTGGWGTTELVVQRKSRAAPIIRHTPVEVCGPCPDDWRDWTFAITDAPLTVLAARDPHGQLKWKVDVSPPATGNPFQRFGSTAALHSLHIAGDRMVLVLSGRFVVLDFSSGPTPTLRWQQDLTGKLDVNGNPPLVGQRIDFLTCGRRRVLPTSMTEMNDASPTGQVLGLTDEFVCYTMGGRLVAADADTGRILWTRLGVPLIVEGTADAEFVTLFDLPRAQAMVYRADDGAEVARQAVGDPGAWLWFEGDRLLTVESAADNSVTARLMQLSTNQIIWERTKLPPSTRFFASDRETLFQWSPTGELAKLRLGDGAPVWKATTPAVTNGNLLRVEHYGELDLVMVGTTSSMFETTRVSSYDPNQQAFQGHVLGLDAKTGDAKWIAEMAPAAIDLVSRPNLPVLPFVARQSDAPRIVNGQFIAPTRFVATFLDKRTGEVLFKTTETAQPQQYQLEIDDREPVITANFSGWMMEFRKDE